MEEKEREGEEFYERLQETYQKIQKYDSVIIIWNFNAKTGNVEIKRKRQVNTQYMTPVTETGKY
jgi:hypothetical protein